MRQQAGTARLQYRTGKSAVDGMKGIEGSLNRTADATARELDRLAGNTSKTIVSIDRAFEIGRTKL